jgi:DNA-binding MarR family transcriptional regulator
MPDTRPLPDRMQSIALVLRSVAALVADAELCPPLWELARSYEDLAKRGPGPGRQVGALEAPQGPNAGSERSTDMLQVFHRAIISLVSHKGADLSASEIGVYLGSYVGDRAPTVPELAAELQMSIPAVYRALEGLAEFDLVRLGRGAAGPDDRAIRRTPIGAGLLRDIKNVLSSAIEDAGKPEASDRVP